MTAPVTFISCFEVPVGDDEEFLLLWRQVSDYAQAKPGYLGHSLHRSLAGSARYRYVNVARWASADQFAAANDDHFRSLVTAPGWSRFPFLPALYEVVDSRADSSNGRTGQPG